MAFFGGVDGTVGGLIDSNGNIAAFGYVGTSRGPQIAGSYGPTLVIAPFANSVQDLRGDSFDVHLRFIFQISLSIPQDPWKTAISIDFLPGINFGFGVGKGKTGICQK